MDVDGIRQCATSIDHACRGLGGSAVAAAPGGLEPTVARAVAELMAAEALFTTRAATRLSQVSRRLNDAAEWATTTDRFAAQ